VAPKGLTWITMTGCPCSPTRQESETFYPAMLGFISCPIAHTKPACSRAFRAAAIGTAPNRALTSDTSIRRGCIKVEQVNGYAPLESKIDS
jgi:hypothetical protein